MILGIPVIPIISLTTMVITLTKVNISPTVVVIIVVTPPVIIMAVIIFLWKVITGWRALWIDNVKVNGALFNVNINNFNPNWLAHLISSMGSPANQCHELFNVLVVVVIHSADMN